MTPRILLVEIEAYDPAVAGVITLRYCTGRAWRTLPGDTPPNALYRPLVIDAGWCRTDVFTRPGQYGHITPGEVVLDDSAGTLGAELIGYRFDARAITIREGVRGAAYPGGYTTILSGALGGPPSFDWRRIVFRPADRAAGMRKPFPAPRYLGDNALPAGLEGVDDLNGRAKPIVLALASNCSPVLVNSSKLIYQVSAPLAALTAAVGVGAARDMGVPLAASGTYATTAQLLDDALAPAAGHYKVLTTVADGCYVRLGSSPIGQVTCDAEYGGAADRTHAQVWKRILLCLGETSGSIATADLAALDAALGGEIEFAVAEGAQGDELLTRVATSAGAAWWGDETGQWRLVHWAAPSGTPVAVLRRQRTLDMDIADPVGTGDVAPAYRVTLQWGRNWMVQPDSSLAGGKANPATDTVRAPGGRAALAARAWLADEWRTLQSTDAAVLTTHPNAIDLKLTSLLADGNAAQAFADAQLTLYQADRHMTTLTQRLSPAQRAAVRVGAVVTVIENRWDYDAGRVMRVAGLQADQATGRSQLSVWG